MNNNNTDGTLFGRSRGPGHRTAAGAMAAERVAPMQLVDKLVVLLGGMCACGVDET